MIDKKFLISFGVSFAVFALIAVILVFAVMGNNINTNPPPENTSSPSPTNTGTPTTEFKRTKTLDLTDSDSFENTEEAWFWDTELKTLIISGVNMDIQDGYGIKLPAGSTVIIADDTINIIKTYGYSISSEGSLTVRGNGSLKIISTDKTPISAKGDISIMGGNISIITSSFYAIRTEGMLAMSGGTLSASSQASAVAYASLSFPQAQPQLKAGEFETTSEAIADSTYLSSYKYVFIDFAPQPTDSPAPPERLNILVTVPDESNLRTDSILIFSVDSKNNKLSITSIPRDLYVHIGSRVDKINTCTVYKDFQFLIDKVEEICGIDIQYYAIMRLSGVRNIVDLLGGVEYDVPQNMKYSDPDQKLYINLQKGHQLLDGKKVEQLLRFRRYVLGDIKRAEVQRDFLKEMITQKITAENIARAPELLAEIFDNVRTNITIADILANLDIYKTLVGDNIEALAVPGYDKYVGDKSYYFFYEEKAYEFFEEHFGGIGKAFNDGSNDVLAEHNISPGSR